VDLGSWHGTAWWDSELPSLAWNDVNHSSSWTVTTKVHTKKITCVMNTVVGKSKFVQFYKDARYHQRKEKSTS
jgi:hypothetical protein